MKTKIQGLLLNKRPFQENHILAHLLLRNGRKIATVFYGGRGGGKKNSPSLLELGYMMDLEMAKTKRNSDLYRAKEWGNAWIHQKIRKEYSAYCLLCFFLEVIEKVAPEEDLWEVHDDPITENEGLFRILSNSIFHLEQMLEAGEKDFSMLVINFMCKLIREQGFFPMTVECCLSEEPITSNEPLVFMHEKGGFAKLENVQEVGVFSKESGKEGAEILTLFKEVTFEKTSELKHRQILNPNLLKSIFHYFCFQNHLQPDTFKTYKMIIS